MGLKRSVREGSGDFFLGKAPFSRFRERPMSSWLHLYTFCFLNRKMLIKKFANSVADLIDIGIFYPEQLNPLFNAKRCFQKIAIRAIFLHSVPHPGVMLLSIKLNTDMIIRDVKIIKEQHFTTPDAEIIKIELVVKFDLVIFQKVSYF
jgi:hypothetical protein